MIALISESYEHTALRERTRIELVAMRYHQDIDGELHEVIVEKPNVGVIAKQYGATITHKPNVVALA
jgi:hypothetical protein